MTLIAQILHGITPSLAISSGKKDPHLQHLQYSKSCLYTEGD
jgi:hypothetical protein